jgi:hypothetical protein
MYFATVDSDSFESQLQEFSVNGSDVNVSAVLQGNLLARRNYPEKIGHTCSFLHLVAAEGVRGKDGV